ncbi:RNA polymerase sigma factor [Cognataquiflexum rubidum]|uniref:RNA polymerase sigma factor n=1 Tax=Cognataquiflexum rubidum TaxID=2922273 RepID=UPI001F12C44F|nr:RNA polymerase sigma factor [Cognataquiflexum rubidum]MCH6233799.1 RNA polymerase sigma factor [Cognataquiflexum rubidum]
MKKHWLETILKELHSEAYHWSRQCCSFDDDRAKDVLQLVYLKILEGKAVYKEKSQVKTWLFSVIRFTAYEEIKKEGKNSSLDQLPDMAYEDDPPENDSHEALLQALPDRQKEVLLMVFYHDMTLEQCAEVMNLHIGTIRTHYDRGKKKLKEWIEKTRIEK